MLPQTVFNLSCCLVDINLNAVSQKWYRNRCNIALQGHPDCGQQVRVLHSHKSFAMVKIRVSEGPELAGNTCERNISKGLTA
jgi:hypothetical protein